MQSSRRKTQKEEIARLLGETSPPIHSNARQQRVPHDVRRMRFDDYTASSVQVPLKKQRRIINEQMSWIDFCFSYTSMLCSYYPQTCCLLLTVSLFMTMLFLASFILNPVQQLGVVQEHHFLNIRSKYDLDIGKVDHWCLRGGDDGCECQDPLLPSDRADHLSWIEAVKDNQQILEGLKSKKVDVAILGESVVEAMGGRWMGRTRNDHMARLKDVFAKNFHPVLSDPRVPVSGSTQTANSNNTDDEYSNIAHPIRGVALGVAGDTAPNVLWRLLQGELPPHFDPHVWWISLGMNDLARMECSEEVVILGILRVVEELLVKRPNARIVINSVLPMAKVRGGAYPLLSDYSQAFTAPPKEGLFGGGRNPNDEDIRRRRLYSFFHKRKDPQHLSPVDKTEAIELARDKKLRKKKRQDPAFAALSNKKQVRKYHLGREDNIPLWTSIRAINRQLEKFTDKPENNRVYFFDATSLFVGKRGEHSKDRVKTNLITLSGYPRPLGFAKWENAILETTREILKDMKRTNPELFGGSSNGEDAISHQFFDETDEEPQDKQPPEDPDFKVPSIVEADDLLDETFSSESDSQDPRQF